MNLLDRIKKGRCIITLTKENQNIIELKSVRRVVKTREIQWVNYLTATDKDIGLILNFGEEKVEIKRKVRTLKSDEQDKKSSPSC